MTITVRAIGPLKTGIGQANGSQSFQAPAGIVDGDTLMLVICAMNQLGSTPPTITAAFGEPMYLPYARGGNGCHNLTTVTVVNAGASISGTSLNVTFSSTNSMTFIGQVIVFTPCRIDTTGSSAYGLTLLQQGVTIPALITGTPDLVLSLASTAAVGTTYNPPVFTATDGATILLQGNANPSSYDPGLVVASRNTLGQAAFAITGAQSTAIMAQIGLVDLSPPPAVYPTGTTDAETLDAPTVTVPVTINPDAAADPETAGAPSLTFVAAPRKTETIQDDFGGTTLDPTWRVDPYGTGTATVSGGFLNLGITDNSTSSSIYVVSNATNLVLSESSFYLRVIPNRKVNTTTEVSFTNLSNGRLARFTLTGTASGIVLWAVTDTGTSAVNFTTPWDSLSWAYWRIRHSGTTLYYDASHDGVSWSTYKSGGPVTWTSAVQIIIKMWVTSTTNTPPHLTQIDSINTVAGSAGYTVYPNPATDVETLAQTILFRPPLLETLWDDFESVAVSNTKWTLSGPVTITGGAASFVSTGSGQGQIESRDLFTFGSNYNTNLVARITRIGPADFEMMAADTTTNLTVGMYISAAGTLYRRTRNAAGTMTQTSLGTYDPVGMQYLRVRMSGTTAYFGISADALNWGDLSSFVPVFTNEFNFRARFVHSTAVSGRTVNVELVNYQPVELLKETFTTGTLDTTKWTQATTNATTSITAGTFSIDTAAGVPYATTTTSLVTKSGFKLPDSSVFALVAPITATDQAFSMKLVNVYVDYYAYFHIRKFGTTLRLEGFRSSGNVIATVDIVYDSTAHAWWRMRHTAGVMYWETSPDADVWTVHTSAPFTFTNTIYTLNFVADWTGPTVDSTVRLDNINTIAPPAVIAAPGNITDPGSTGTPDVTITYTANPDSVTDPETVDAPTVTQDVTVNPDSAADPETLDAPTVAETFDVNPDGISDPETVDDPTVTTSTDTTITPDSATDPETLDTPTVTQPAPDVTPDSLTDPETVDGPAVTQGTPQDVTVNPDGILDPETIDAATAIPPPKPGLLETLWDDFATPTASAAKWPTMSAGVTVAGGVATMRANGSALTLASNSFYWFGSISYQTLFTAKVTLAGGADNAEMRIRDSTGAAYVSIRVSGGNLIRTYVNTSGVANNFTLGAYDPATMAYWRVRNISTGFYFGYSADAINWTEVSSSTISATFGSWTAIQAQFQTTADADTNKIVYVDNVNVWPPLETLQDTFPGTAINPPRWQFTGGSGCTAAVSGGTLSLNTPAGSTTGTSSFTFGSQGRYTLDGSYTYAKVTPSANANQYLDLKVRNPGTGEYFRIGKAGTSLYLNGYTGSVAINPTPNSVPFNAATMAWWCLRYLNGTVYWDTSPDGANWTTRASIAYTLKEPGYRFEFFSQWIATSTATTVRVDAVSVDGAPPPVITPITPDSIQDPETLGQPTANQPAPVHPDGIGDPETVGLPDVTQAFTVHPLPIQDPETLDDPAITVEGPMLVEPDSIEDPEILGAGVKTAPILYPDGIIDPETFGQPTLLFVQEKDNWRYGAAIYSHGPYYGYLVPVPGCKPNIKYGSGTYGCGIYYGYSIPTIGDPELFADIAAYGPPLHILGIGPWNATTDWRGAANYNIQPGPLPPTTPPTTTPTTPALRALSQTVTGIGNNSRPVLALPPTTNKGFTLRLDGGSEARTDHQLQRGQAVIIDEMDTDLWWRRKDPRTKKLEVIGRFNSNNVALATSDTGVNLSAHWEDYATILGNRLILEYLNPEVKPNPTTMWPQGTPVTDILAWALPKNTGLDLSEVTGDNPYPLGGISQAYHLPPGTLISDVFDNLEALSAKNWEWWIETPNDVNAAPKLRFIVGQRGIDQGVTLFDAGSGPTPIASWTRTGSTDNYANTLYYTGSGTGEGQYAGGGVVETIPAQVEQYGQRDAQEGSATNGGNIDQIRAGATKKLNMLSDRRPSYTIILTQGFWRGRSHIDIGDTIRLVLRLGKEVLNDKYRVTEIDVDIDDNNYETVTLTLGKPPASADPRSRRSPIIRLIRAIKNYQVPDKALDVPEDDN